MDNYFTSFCLLTYVGVNNIRVTGAFNKKKLRKCTITRDKELQKKNVTIWTAHIKQKSSENFIFAIYLRICKTCVIFLKLFTNFPYSQITTR